MMLVAGIVTAGVLSRHTVGMQARLPLSLGGAATGQHLRALPPPALPLSFEPNRGQADPSVKFVGHGDGSDLLFTSDGTVVESIASGSRSGSARTVLRLRAIGANSSPGAEGIDLLPGISNYITGSDPGAWRTGVPHYAAVAYRGLLPGVDMVFHDGGGLPEYDLITAPGVDPQGVVLSLEGAGRLSLSDSGDLVAAVNDGELRQPRPHIYQGDGASRHDIAGGFRLLGPDRIGFWIGEHDRSQPLVIDPTLTYSTYLGGSKIDDASSLATDGSNMYVLGQTTSLDFPTTAGSYEPRQGAALPSTPLGSSQCSSGCSLFVAKINPAATGVTSVIWATYLSTRTSEHAAGNFVGGLAPLMPGGIAVDPSGSAVITGTTRSPDFPTTAGAYQPVLTAPSAAFVTRFDATGTRLLYSTFLGGTGLPPVPVCVALCHLTSAIQGNTVGSSVAIDGHGHAFVTGATNSSQFPVKGGVQSSLNRSSTPGAGIATMCGSLANPIDPSTAVCYDAFVSELDTTAAGPVAGKVSLVYSTLLGGQGNDYGRAVAVDGAGNAYVAGNTASTTFPVQNAYQATSPGPGAAFLTKLNVAGNQILYSTYLGGSGGRSSDGVAGLAVDSSGNAYLAGTSSSASYPTASAFQTTLGGSSNGTVTKLNTTASGVASLVYSTYLGGSAVDGASAIAVDGTGSAAVTGTTSSANFPTTAGALQTTLHASGTNCGSSTCSDAFLTKIGPTGASLSYSTYLGGSGSDLGEAVAIASSGATFVAGSTSSADFPTVGPFQASMLGSSTAFVSAFSP